VAIVQDNAGLFRSFLIIQLTTVTNATFFTNC